MSKRHTEEAITATWSHVVPDTLCFETEGSHANKQTVEIRTRDIHGEFDGNTRRIATSDLFQCFWTVETKAELDKAKRSAKRQLRAGKTLPDRLATLDSVEQAQVTLCLTPNHPRIVAAQAKLTEEGEAEERREERKAAKAEDDEPVVLVDDEKPSTEEAAELLGVA